MGEIRRINLLDLTVDQTEALETELGAPVDGWSDLPSRMKVLRRVYAVVTGTDDATIGTFTLAQLTDAVSMSEDTETENPT